MLNAGPLQGECQHGYLAGGLSIQVVSNEGGTALDGKPGSENSSHSSVHVEGIPPGGHSTPVVQQASVTVCAIAMNSINVPQFRGASV